MSKGKMLLGQNVYRDLFKVIRDSGNMAEVLCHNPYTKEQYSRAWINLADYLWRTMKPETEKFGSMFMYDLVREVSNKVAYFIRNPLYAAPVNERLDSWVEQVFLYGKRDTPARRHAVKIVKDSMEYGFDHDFEIWFKYSDLVLHVVLAKRKLKAARKNRFLEKAYREQENRVARARNSEMYLNPAN